MRARDSISLSDNGGDGSLTYNSSTGALFIQVQVLLKQGHIFQVVLEWE